MAGPSPNDPRNALPMWNAGAPNTYNSAANTAGHQIDTGKGTFAGINTNTAGVTSSATFYDGTTTGGRKLGTFDTTKIGPNGIALQYVTGLFVVLAGGTPADVTAAYHPAD